MFQKINGNNVSNSKQEAKCENLGNVLQQPKKRVLLFLEVDNLVLLDGNVGDICFGVEEILLRDPQYLVSNFDILLLLDALF